MHVVEEGTGVCFAFVLNVHGFKWVFLGISGSGCCCCKGASAGVCQHIPRHKICDTFFLEK